MAQHLNHILGDKLLKSTLDGKAPIGLPSPEVSSAVCCPNPTSLYLLVAGLTGLVRLYTSCLWTAGSANAKSWEKCNAGSPDKKVAPGLALAAT